MEEEEGASTRSLLVIENHGKSDDEFSSSSSSITFVLLFSTFIAICGAFTLGNSLGYSSPAESEILEDLGLSLAEYSVFGSILTIGGLIGAALSGKITDLFGRRGAMWFSDAFCISGWVSITLSEGAWSLDLGRLLQGFGVGVLSYVVPVYVAEITPNKFRGAFTSLNMFMTATGISAAFIIGSYIHWRTLALIGMIPLVVQFLGVFFIPESPRWLAKLGREQELEAALRRLRGKSTDISHEASEIIDYTENLNRIVEHGIMELFQRKYAHAVTVGVGLMLLQQFGGLSGYTSYLSFILESAGFPSGVGSEAASVVQITMNVCCTLLVDKFGRRPLLLVSASGMCLGSLITGSSFVLQDYELLKEVTPVMTLIGILVFVASMCMGVGGIPWIMISEIYPVNIKGAAGSVANIINWSGSWIVTYTFNYLFEYSSAGVFFIYATFAGLGIIFVAKLVPETKGRTLEEIQSSIILD